MSCSLTSNRRGTAAQGWDCDGETPIAEVFVDAESMCIESRISQCTVECEPCSGLGRVLRGGNSVGQEAVAVQDGGRDMCPLNMGHVLI